MDSDVVQFALQVIGIIVTAAFTAGAIYGAIKAELRSLHERMGQVERTTDAVHRRLDTLLNRRSWRDNPREKKDQLTDH